MYILPRQVLNLKLNKARHIVIKGGGTGLTGVCVEISYTVPLVILIQLSFIFLTCNRHTHIYDTDVNIYIHLIYIHNYIFRAKDRDKKTITYLNLARLLLSRVYLF